MAQTAIYDSVPLPCRADSDIRLIELFPGPVIVGDKSYDFECKFHVESLSSPPPYTAVSYMWGESIETLAILLDGKPFDIRSNLFDLLKRLSRQHTSLLWVDAICINQTTIHERNHQVGLMGQIYSKAERVVIWLGTDPSVADSIEELQSVDLEGELTVGRSASLLPLNIGEVLHEPSTRVILDSSSRSSRGRIRINVEPPRIKPRVGRARNRPLSPNQIESHARSIQNRVWAFCSHPYWSRAWIIQEFVLARDIEIWACSSNVELSKLASKVYLMRGNYKRWGLPQGVAAILDSPASKLILKREKWRQSHGRSYMNPWDSGFGILGCADVRDRVYAMAALMDPRIAVIPDYNKDAADILRDIFEKHLERNGRLVGTIWNLQALLEIEDGHPVVEKARVHGSLDYNPFWQAY